MPKPPTVEKVAAALRITPQKLREMRGDPETKPFTLPPGAERLGAADRRAVIEVIYALGKHQEREWNLTERDGALIREMANRASTSLRAQAALLDWADGRIAPGDRDEFFERVRSGAEPLESLLELLTEHADQFQSHRQQLLKELKSLARFVPTKEKEHASTDSSTAKSDASGEAPEAEEDRPPTREELDLAARTEDDPKEDHELQ